MAQIHLNYKDRVNLGSYYTPPAIVNLAWDILMPHLDLSTTIIDSACGYGDFLKNYNDLHTIGCDLDEVAVQIAKKNNHNVHFFQTNSLNNVSREKFGIPKHSRLAVVGNPPYNDKTSLIRRNIKNVTFNVDNDINSRDLGISFLLSYNKLNADFICVLHPLSYLIKPANFKLLRNFSANYKLIDGYLVSSNEFLESANFTPFPILIALYKRDKAGMDYNYIRSFPFKATSKANLRIADFDYISNYVDKYPNKKNQYLVNEDSLFFWTMRDINALKRNQTFTTKYSKNAVLIDKEKLDYYIYVDVFKRNLHRLPFYFGNCDVIIDHDLFQQYKYYFINDAIERHPYLKKYLRVQTIKTEQTNLKLDMYFNSLLEGHHAYL